MPRRNTRIQADLLCELVVQTQSGWQKVMPDDHSEVVPLLPIPNRTVKRLCADDSADSRVKVGHRQALNTSHPRPLVLHSAWGFGLSGEHCFCQASILLLVGR